MRYIGWRRRGWGPPCLWWRRWRRSVTRRPRRRPLPRGGGFRPGVGLVFLLLLALAVWGFTGLERGLRPTVAAVTEAVANQAAVDAITTALAETLGGQTDYRDLVFLEQTGDGRVAFMQPNTAEINRLAALVTAVVQRELKRLEGWTVSVPLGQVLGSQVLAAHGPRINIRLVPVGYTRVRIRDGFEAQGINQTRHSIWADIEATVRVVFPLISREIQVTTSAPIAEGIIVGEVPRTYIRIDVQGPLTPVLPLPEGGGGGQARAGGETPVLQQRVLAIHGRVCSHEQKAKGDLDRQVAHIRAAMAG